jgi:dTDP-4-amino-4,6-dideoxygalactose transaminase
LDDRTEFISYMRSHGIICPFHYVPLHSSPSGQRYGRTEGPMLATQAISETLVRLPMFFDLGSQVENVIDVAMSFFDRAEKVRG